MPMRGHRCTLALTHTHTHTQAILMQRYTELEGARAATLAAIDEQQWAAALAASRAACATCAQLVPPGAASCRRRYLPMTPI